MNKDDLQITGGGDNPHNDEAAEGALWNSDQTRRRFLKKSGAASVVTAMAWHGMRVEVYANDSTNPWEIRLSSTSNTGDEQPSGTPEQDGGDWYRWSRSQEITVTAADSPNGGWAGSKTFEVTVVLNTIRQKLVGGTIASPESEQEWENQSGEGDIISGPTHSRSAQFTIDSSGNVSTTYSGETDSDTVSGMKVVVNFSSSGAQGTHCDIECSGSGVAGKAIPSDSMDAGAEVEKRNTNANSS